MVKRKTSVQEETNEEKKKRKESNNCCFICKGGGRLHRCDHHDCGKAYHPGCLKNSELPKLSGKPWHCSRHTCSKCSNPSTFFCYCCPTALCDNCVNAEEFLPIKNQCGFCQDCWRKALSLEEAGPSESLDERSRLFKEYYENVKKDEGISLEDLQSLGMSSERIQKEKSYSSGGTGDLEKDANLIEWKGQEQVFASIDIHNIKFVYMRRSFIEQLFEQPESFESKVKGTYVGVKTPRDIKWDISYRLMQVAGVKKDSNGHNTDKLLLLGMPNENPIGIPMEISVSSLSDGNLNEAQCGDLKERMEAGLLKQPTVDELQEKASMLHVEITEHGLALEKRRLQDRIDHIRGTSRPIMALEFMNKLKVLKQPSHREMLLNTLPVVIPEPPKPYTELKDQDLAVSNEPHVEIQDSSTQPDVSSAQRHEAQGASKSPLTTTRAMIEATDEFQSKALTSGAPIPTTRATDPISVSHGGGFPPLLAAIAAIQPTFISHEKASHRGGAAKTQHMEQPTSVSRGYASPREGQSAYPSEEGRQNLTPEVDMELDEVLDKLIKPDELCIYADANSYELVKKLEGVLIRFLERVPISNSGNIITIANAAFTFCKEVSINYSSFYERVKNYVYSCLLLSSTEQFKQGSSMEELAARYKSGKEYNEMVHKGMKKLSTSSGEAFFMLGKQISDEERIYVKFENENSYVGEMEHQSRTLREVLNKLKKMQAEIKEDLEPPVKSKKQCYFEQVWEAFMKAKAAFLS